MAYMSQEKKSKIAPVVKKILTKYGMKGSLSVDNHSTLVLTLKSGNLDIIGNYNETIGQRDPTGSKHINLAKDSLQVNTHWIKDHYTGTVRKFLEEVCNAMNAGNHDNSQIEVDYFDVGWYVNIYVGKWNKPYEYTGKTATVKTTRVLKPSQRIRIILNGISFRTTIGELDNCMDHTNQRTAVNMALVALEDKSITGYASRHNGFDVQVDLV